jgi:hypothetical protein
VAALALLPLNAGYTAAFGSTWGKVTRRKHADDFARFLTWLEANGLPVTTASLDLMTQVSYVTELRSRPKVAGVWRGDPDALARTAPYDSGPDPVSEQRERVRPALRSLAIWLVDEGLLAAGRVVIEYVGLVRRRTRN